MTTVISAILNSLWQAAGLALVVWLALRLGGARLNAATRHWIWWMALAAMVALPFLPRSTAAKPMPVHRPPEVASAAALFPLRVQGALVPGEAVTLTVRPRRNAVWPYGLLAVWAAVFGARALSLLRGYRKLRGLKRRSAVSPCSLADATRHDFPRSGMLRVLLSTETSSPIAAGFLKPAIILPAHLIEQLSRPELDCVLLHEAAHLARYDDWTNLAAQVVGAALFFHPVVWWVLRQIEREREVACDDWVVARTGAARRYAESLARIVELRLRPEESALATGIFTRRSRLVQRIELLLGRGRKFSAAAARVPVSVAAATLAALAIAGTLAPRWIAFAQRPEFEVASVKVSAPNQEFGFAVRRTGDRVSWHMVHIGSVMSYAYHLPIYQMIGYDKSPIAYEWYDLDAKTKADATDDEVRLMFQSLIEDRFQLKTHKENRELPEYVLTVAKGKSKMTPASNDERMKFEIEGRQLSWPKGACGGTGWTDGSRIICHAAPISQLVSTLRGELGSPVADQTGLTGTYDLILRFISDRSPMRPDAEPGPSLPSALETELGLKLEKGKGPVEVMVIDRLVKPSEN